MATRRQAREWAVQLLFQLDVNPREDQTPDEIFADFWEGQLRLRDEEKDDAKKIDVPDPHARDFTESLVRGVMHNRDEIDKRLEARMPNWSVDRLGGEERAILRMGTYELAFDPDPAPPAVVINEAVELIKIFTGVPVNHTCKAGNFVNGILDAIARRQRSEKDKAKAKAETWSPTDKPE